jgi:hypothetical protein
MQEWFLEAAHRAPGERAECISRAPGARRITTGQAASSGWEEKRPGRTVGASTVELTRQPNRPPRQAPLRVALK